MLHNLTARNPISPRLFDPLVHCQLLKLYALSVFNSASDTGYLVMLRSGDCPRNLLTCVWYMQTFNHVLPTYLWSCHIVSASKRSLAPFIRNLAYADACILNLNVVPYIDLD